MFLSKEYRLVLTIWNLILWRLLAFTILFMWIWLGDVLHISLLSDKLGTHTYFFCICLKYFNFALKKTHAWLLQYNETTVMWQQLKIYGLQIFMNWHIGDYLLALDEIIIQLLHNCPDSELLTLIYIRFSLNIRDRWVELNSILHTRRCKRHTWEAKASYSSVSCALTSTRTYNPV